MARHVRLVAALSLLALGAIGVSGAEDTADAPELAKYKRTGQYQLCIDTHALKTSTILNKRQILFEMRTGGEAYLAEPDCPNLRRGYAISYDASIGELCNTSIIRLIESGSPIREWGTCGIDRFEKLEKVEKPQ